MSYGNSMELNYSYYPWSQIYCIPHQELYDRCHLMS